MKKPKGKKTILHFTFYLLILFFPIMVFAVCPVCSVAVAGGVSLSRYLKVDDAISGIWIGGLILSLAFWLLDWLKKRNINFFFRNFFVVSGFYLLVILPLYFGKFIGYSYNKILGVDRLLFGIIVGSAGFWAGTAFDYFFRKRNQGKVYFPFQKVVFPLSLLLTLSIVFWLCC